MLFKVQKQFDDGTKVDELVYSEGAYIIHPKQQNISYCHVTLFKYKYEGHIMPPTLINLPTGERYIVPYWQLVHPQTTLDDIEWIKPQPKKLDTVKFEVTGSNGDKYKTIYNPNTKKWKCSCPGHWRAKDGLCKHIKAKLGPVN